VTKLKGVLPGDVSWTS